MAGKEFKAKKKTVWEWNQEELNLSENEEMDVLEEDHFGSEKSKKDQIRKKMVSKAHQESEMNDTMEAESEGDDFFEPSNVQERNQTEQKEQTQYFESRNEEGSSAKNHPVKDAKKRYRKRYQQTYSNEHATKSGQSAMQPETKAHFGSEADSSRRMITGAGNNEAKAVHILSDTGEFILQKSQVEQEEDEDETKEPPLSVAVKSVQMISAYMGKIRHTKSEKIHDNKVYWNDAPRNVRWEAREFDQSKEEKPGRRQYLKKQEQKRRMRSDTWHRWNVSEQKNFPGKSKIKRRRSVKETGKQMFDAIRENNKPLLVPVAILALILFLIVAFVGSCTVSMQGAGSLIGMTSYVSSDEIIRAVEDYYAGLEEKLNSQINSMEKAHPGYDEYRYQVDEISHNPYQLISYLTAKYQEFTFDEVKEELDELFAAQYTLATKSSTETVTEKKTVKVGESLGTVMTSGYCNCTICCGKWAGGVTASGVKPTSKHTLAVDAKHPIVPLGTKIIMNGIEYTVEDTGNFARYGVDFDVYYDNHLQALAHGHKQWEAYLADSNGSKEITTTVTTTKQIYSIQLTNHTFQSVAENRMNRSEKKLYETLNVTYGNRNYLFDMTALPSGNTEGFRYEIPPEALSDAKFAGMITEAEKYLGMPYVWGGDSPQTGFDCSGFASWVINHSNNGWNLGRQTANGLMNQCIAVSPEEARPGDLVFFEKTYQTSGASHVGIYVGNGMMIHCGNPIQYTNINIAYWQQHFLGFGRLP